MAKRKCVICGEWIEDNTQSVPYKKRYAHNKCFEKEVRQIQKEKKQQLKEKETKGRKAKPKAELKEAVSEEEYKEKKQYYQYLRMLSSEEELSAKVYALSESYITRYKFTWNSMYTTLVYLHEIIDKELEGDIVGIIPYYYTEAQQYYESIKKVKEANQEIDTTNMYKKRVIHIKPQEKRKIKQIDIESIGGNI